MWPCILIALMVAGAPLERNQTSAADRLATISGTVTDNRGAPVKLAVVSLSGRGLQSIRTTSTDSTGHFTFPAVPAGQFTVAAAKQGLLRSSYGSRRPGRPGTTLPIVGGQRLENVNIVLPKAGVIAGTVVDQSGESLAGIDVRALRFVVENGARRLMQVGADRSDDRGAYRISQLPPGNYLVSAVTAFLDPEDNETIEGREYAPVYFPGTASAEGALKVQLQPSQERADVDIVFPIVPTVKVGGTVSISGANNKCDPDLAMVPLAPGLPSVVGVEVNTTAAEGGRFAFSGVAPGRYRIEARCTLERGHALWASRIIAVEEKDLNAIDLTMRLGMTVTGQLAFTRSGGLPEAGASSVRVALIPWGDEFAELGRYPLLASIEPSGRFVISGVPPGRYEINATASMGRGRSSSATARWRAESAVVNGRDALDFLLDVVPDEDIAGLQLSFTQREQSITGSLVDPLGRPASDCTVIIFAADSRYWLPESRRIAIAFPASDGTYFAGSLPPGDYRVAAVTDVESGEWFDPDFLRVLVPASVAVTLREGQRLVQNLKVK